MYRPPDSCYSAASGEGVSSIVRSWCHVHRSSLRLGSSNEPPPLCGQPAAVAGRLRTRASQRAGCHAAPLAPGFVGRFGSRPPRAREWDSSGCEGTAHRGTTGGRNGEDTRSKQHDDQVLPERQGQPPGQARRCRAGFSGGPLDGLKLIGFAVWERRNGGRTVTFPARRYSVNGERRSFALLRPTVDTASQDRLRDVILEAYKEHEAALEATA